MRETLIVRLPSQPDGPVQWLVRAAPGAEADGPPQPADGELDQALALAHGRRLVVLAPAEDVLLTSASLAVRQTSRLLQAVPYALEEQLAQDIEDLHFALGPRQSDGKVPVAVVSHARMEQWLAPFRAAGQLPELLLPEALALGGGDEELVLLLEGSRCLLRQGAYQGFACEPQALSALLGLLDTGDGISLLRCASELDLPEGLSLKRSEQPAHPLLALREAGDSFRLNLLQGAYAPKRAADQWLQAARWPASLAAGWLLLATVGLAISNASLSAERDALGAAAEENFRSAFPGITRIVDLRAQARQQLRLLRGSGSQGGFLPLLTASAQALDGVQALQLDGTQFRDGSLYLSLSGSDLQALELLRANFARNPELALDVQSAQAGSDGVQIRLKIDAAAGAS